MGLRGSLFNVPMSPCGSGLCPKVRYKACEENQERECEAFHQYINSRRGKFNFDNIGRMRKN